MTMTGKVKELAWKQEQLCTLVWYKSWIFAGDKLTLISPSHPFFLLSLSIQITEPYQGAEKKITKPLLHRKCQS